jgi:hypothetical protein
MRHDPHVKEDMRKLALMLALTALALTLPGAATSPG